MKPLKLNIHHFLLSQTGASCSCHLIFCFTSPGLQQKTNSSLLSPRKQDSYLSQSPPCVISFHIPPAVFRSFFFFKSHCVPILPWGTPDEVQKDSYSLLILTAFQTAVENVGQVYGCLVFECFPYPDPIRTFSLCTWSQSSSSGFGNNQK